MRGRGSCVQKNTKVEQFSLALPPLAAPAYNITSLPSNDLVFEHLIDFRRRKKIKKKKNSVISIN